MNRTRRNLLVATTTSVVVAALFAFPTSTNRTDHPRKPGQPLAPAGVVVGP